MITAINVIFCNGIYNHKSNNYRGNSNYKSDFSNMHSYKLDQFVHKILATLND